VFQLSLFEARANGDDLVDDQWGRFTYTPRLLDTETAAAWFAELKQSVRWKAERRFMYEREVDVPRLTAGYGLGADGAAAADAAPPPLWQALALVSARAQAPFDSVGLNLYRDGRDSVAPHNDHLDEIAVGAPIALLSLGAVRRMAIRAKPPRRLSLDVDLEPGSLLVMSYETQLHYTHGIPKTNKPVGERISLAFRVKRQGEGARGGRLYR
jgi:alkylated DNA repair dioxygenase AlkB